MPIHTILIVDDSATERLAMTQALSSKGYEVIAAENGADAIAKSRKHRPDLILMDIVMPGMDGYQATRTISRHPATRGIPIIICSSKGNQTDRLWALRQGARAYLVKPVKMAELFQQIKALDA